MRLSIPTKIVDFDAKDTNGNSIKLTDYEGRAVLLSFFRDTSCPFCLKRVFELRARAKQWQKMGIEVIAIFSSSEEQIQQFSGAQPKNLIVIADPSLKIHNLYGVEHSWGGVFKTLMFKFPTIVKAVAKGARPLKSEHLNLMPADFLINDEGMIVDLHYGSNGDDHIPGERVDRFVKLMLLKFKSKQSDKVA